MTVVDSRVKTLVDATGSGRVAVEAIRELVIEHDVDWSTAVSVMWRAVDEGRLNYTTMARLEPVGRHED